MFKLKIPPPVYMLIMAWGMWLLDNFFPITHIIIAPWNNLGLLVIIFAIFIDSLSLMQFFRAHTTINPIHPEKTEKLVLSGAYRYTRNPMYLGLLFLLLGWAIILGSLSPYIILPVFIWIITIEQIIPEEQVLQQKFGEKYRNYKKSVNRWL